MAAIVVSLNYHESVEQDLSRISIMYSDLGMASADQIVARAHGEMSFSLSRIGDMIAKRETQDIGRRLKRLRLLAENLGMTSFVTVTTAVFECHERADTTAFAAVWERLKRIADASLISKYGKAGISQG